MIVSHRNRFIFLKTRKTAGSSTEIALSRLCDTNDIVTPLIEKRGEEELRKAEGGYGPVNALKKPLQHYGRKEWQRLLLKAQRAPWKTHSRPHHIRRGIGKKKWDQYLKVTIERNPWDRAISRYYWMKARALEAGEKEFPSITNFLLKLEKEKPALLSNWGLYTIKDTVIADKVIFYESLNEGLSDLERCLGLSEGLLSLPSVHAKSGFREDKRPYQEVLSEIDREIIARVCRNEIEAFGYTF
ncbi:Sulfotransferase family protein [Thiohalospira halophila DSM 15071]|uniref:Sulfotransferase family protein n=1 Tax=Thiohalospira halophila DSM 15071 TaxID=1123397 RepID=A0A1I1RRF5_9GAMM|nr:sulfotransferase family 2 domain-containing protein [Thiohalospira halophila]SFD36916.1 Sulfotransferase family protein [Thiohalospira halophila DSM 15071]